MISKARMRRIVAAILVAVPAFLLPLLAHQAQLNIEAWLSEKTNGYFRQDAFQDVAGILPMFVDVLAYTLLFAACLIVVHQEREIFLLFIGPACGVTIYVLESGFTDPSWFLVLALMSIGMLVGTSVTAVWVMFKQSRNRFRPRGTS